MSKRILFLSYKFYPDIGGIEVNSNILANAFHNAGHIVKLVTWTEETDSMDFPFLVIRKPDLRALLKEHSWADIVFENNPSIRLSWPSVFFNRPSVVALCTWITRASGEISWLDRFKLLWLKRAFSVIAVSDAVRQRCYEKAVVIGNPYDVNVFRVLPNIPRTNDFVFLGRLVSDKGAHLAIKALSNLISGKQNNEPACRNLSLTIVGDGPERNSLEKLSVELGVGKQVTFTGTLKGNDLATCLNRHRFLLVPSSWEEPFGNVALEGMACGCIPIVSDGGGLPDAVGHAGMTFKRGDVDGLTAAMQIVLNNIHIANKLSKAAEDHLRAHHPDKISRLYLKIIENAINYEHQ